jgi:hypothetical protein
MKQKAANLLLLTVPLVLSAIAGGAFAAKFTPADIAWIDKCMDQLKLENSNRQVVRKYCICMHEVFEDNTDASQNEMEHMFPPMHRLCITRSGWRRD